MLSELRAELREIKKDIRASIYGEKPIESADVTAKVVLDWEKLYLVQEQWNEFVFNNPNASKDPKVVNIYLLLGARDYGKTEVVPKLGVVQELAKNPNLTFLLATRKEARAKKILKSLHHPMKQLGFKADYLSESINLKSNRTKQDTYSICNGSESSLRGNHVNWLIGDDLVIGSDERSEIERENTIAFYQEALNVSKNIVILGQPVHEEDLYAVIEKAFLVNKEEIGDKEAINIMVMRSPHGSIPERDKDLGSLKLAGVSNRNVEKNYNLRLIKDELYPFANIPAEEFYFSSYTEACIDPAFGGDDFVGVAIAVQKNDKFYCLVKRFGHNVYDEQQNIITYLKQNNVTRCYVERNDGGKNEIGGLVRKLREAELDISFRAYISSHENKHDRILSDIGLHRDNIVLSTLGDYLKIQDFTKGIKHDDVPDSLAYLLNFLSGNQRKVKVL